MEGNDAKAGYSSPVIAMVMTGISRDFCDEMNVNISRTTTPGESESRQIVHGDGGIFDDNLDGRREESIWDE